MLKEINLLYQIKIGQVCTFIFAFSNHGYYIIITNFKYHAYYIAHIFGHLENEKGHTTVGKTI